ncbi:MAG TPA: DUF6531 domain-containing protein, partial [Gemmatimonadaceae bacterium]|nr:DUF6531 domain-containing protein [Gemmatimonadaceae bacterium]
MHARVISCLGLLLVVALSEGDATADWCDCTMCSCVPWDPPDGDPDVPFDEVPKISYPSDPVGPNHGLAVARAKRNAIQLSSTTTDGDSFGAALTCTPAVEQAASDLVAPAECDGSAIEAALASPATGDVPVSTEQGAQQTIHPDTSGSEGDGGKFEPVDPVTGEFIIRETDLELPSPGVALQLRRTYRSRIDFVGGPLGPAWDHSLNQRLVNAPRVEVGDGDPPPGNTRLGDAMVTVPVVNVSSTCGPSLLLSTGEGTSVRFNEISNAGGTHTYWSRAALVTLRGTDGPDGTTWTLRSPDGSV